MARGAGFFRCSSVASAQAMIAGEFLDFIFNISMMEVSERRSDSRLVGMACVMRVLKLMRSVIAASLFGD